MKKPDLRLIILTLAIAVIALPLLWGPDGAVKNDWLRFIGGFHPLIVHFPIALILLIPALELFARYGGEKNNHATVSLILKLAFLASLIAPVLGWGLAWGDGFAGDLVTDHMWSGILTPMSCGLLLIFHSANQQKPYIFMLCVAVLHVSWTGYLGGQLSHGRDHLTENMPDIMRSSLGMEKRQFVSADDPDSFFGGRLAPLFAARCVSCHGADKIKGQLRLDSYAFLMQGGKNGNVIEMGDAQSSEMIRRITLETTHDEFMPAEGNPAMTADEIKLITMWIDDGALMELSSDALANAPVISASLLPVEVFVPDYDPEAAKMARAQFADAVITLQSKYPFILNYISRNSAMLDLNAAMMRGNFGDDDLLGFEPILTQIIRADFNNTAITDASMTQIEKMTAINNLRLNKTALSDESLLKLTVLNSLKSLNLQGLDVSDETKNTLDNLSQLENLYLDQ